VHDGEEEEKEGLRAFGAPHLPNLLGVSLWLVL